MSKLEKLFRQALANPNSVRFSDLDRLLRAYGFAVSQPRGGSSHYSYVRDDYRLVVPKHGNNGVKAVYVRQVMTVLQTLRLEEAE